MLANTLEARAILRTVLGTSIRDSWTDAAKDGTKRLVAFRVDVSDLEETRNLAEAAFRKAGFSNPVKATDGNGTSYRYIRVVTSFNRFARF